MRDIEQKLRTDLRIARANLDEAERSAERSRMLIEYITGLLEEGSGLFEHSDHDASNGKAEPPVPTSNVGNFANMSTPEMITRILYEAQGELRVNEIVERAIAGGYLGPNADPRKVSNYVSSALARAAKNPNHPVIRKLGRGRFTIAPAAVPR